MINKVEFDRVWKSLKDKDIYIALELLKTMDVSLDSKIDMLIDRNKELEERILGLEGKLNIVNKDNGDNIENVEGDIEDVENVNIENVEDDIENTKDEVNDNDIE